VEENRKVKINMVDIWMLAVMPPDYQTIKRENSKQHFPIRELSLTFDKRLILESNREKGTPGVLD